LPAFNRRLFPEIDEPWLNPMNRHSPLLDKAISPVGEAGALSLSSRDGTLKQAEGSSSIALNNMRGVVIAFVLAFHSFLAYLRFPAPSAPPFDQSPFEWRAFPLMDANRWLGFDLFCAWQDVYLMSLFFFLSALFAWPSLTRRTDRTYLSDRLLRLATPFIFGVAVVTPVALYPAYLVRTVDPSLSDYGHRLLALPFWPNGPMWFLWQLLAFSLIPVGLRRFAPSWLLFLARISSSAATHPGRYFIGLAMVATLAYAPLALAFTPWDWNEHGPFALQLSRPLLYAAYYIAGLGVGIYGVERGLLNVDGMLARRWRGWLGQAFVYLIVWMGLTSLAMDRPAAFPLQLAADVSFVLAGAAGCFFMLGACLRFGVARSRLLDLLSHNAFGMFLLHYPFVVWLQYALLGTALFAAAKAAIVFCLTLAGALLTTIGLRRLPFGSRLIGEAHRRAPAWRETFKPSRNSP
jgi:glucan biosynthesis protein C